MGPVKETQTRTYGGQTGDERLAARREALLEAAFALVAAHGWRPLSIEAVCREAGLNKRYFYEGFTDLDALIGAVTTRLAEDAITAALAPVAPDAAPEDATRAAVTAFVAHLTNDPRRARVLFGAVPAADAAAGHRSAAMRRVITTVAAEGRSIHHLAHTPTVELSAAMLVGGTSQAVLDWLDTPGYPREAFVEDLIAFWQAIGDTAAARVRAQAGD